MDECFNDECHEDVMTENTETALVPTNGLTDGALVLQDRVNALERFEETAETELMDLTLRANHPEWCAGIKDMRRELQNQITLIGVLAGLCLGVALCMATVVLVA